jgi:hypothetical protein
MNRVLGARFSLNGRSLRLAFLKRSQMEPRDMPGGLPRVRPLPPITAEATEEPPGEKKPPGGLLEAPVGTPAPRGGESFLPGLEPHLPELPEGAPEEDQFVHLMNRNRPYGHEPFTTEEIREFLQKRKAAYGSKKSSKRQQNQDELTGLSEMLEGAGVDPHAQEYPKRPAGYITKPEERRQKIAELHASGHRPRHIANLTGLDEKTVLRHLGELGGEKKSMSVLGARFSLSRILGAVRLSGEEAGETPETPLTFLQPHLYHNGTRDRDTSAIGSNRRDRGHERMRHARNAMLTSFISGKPHTHVTRDEVFVAHPSGAVTAHHGGSHELVNATTEHGEPFRYVGFDQGAHDRAKRRAESEHGAARDAGNVYMRLHVPGARGRDQYFVGALKAALHESSKPEEQRDQEPLLIFSDLLGEHGFDEHAHLLRKLLNEKYPEGHPHAGQRLWRTPGADDLLEYLSLKPRKWWTEDSTNRYSVAQPEASPDVTVPVKLPGWQS